MITEPRVTRVVPVPEVVSPPSAVPEPTRPPSVMSPVPEARLRVPTPSTVPVRLMAAPAPVLMELAPATTRLAIVTAWAGVITWPWTCVAPAVWVRPPVKVSWSLTPLPRVTRPVLRRVSGLVTVVESPSRLMA